MRTVDNASEPFDIICNDAALADVWCPLGPMSDPISFNRSRGEIDTEGDGARSPINYATAYLDLDWLYGRDEDSAAEIRAFENGYLNLTEDQLPHQLVDGVWLVSAHVTLVVCTTRGGGGREIIDERCRDGQVLKGHWWRQGADLARSCQRLRLRRLTVTPVGYVRVF